MEALLSNEWIFWGVLIGTWLIVLVFGWFIYRLGVVGTEAGKEQSAYWADVIGEFITSSAVDSVMQMLDDRAERTTNKLDDLAVDSLLAVQKRLEEHLKQRQGEGEQQSEGEIAQ
jgi:hypothetical protein